MKIENLNLPDIKLVTCKKLGDDRGFFCERFRDDIFAEAGLPSKYIQENFSRSESKVLRGLHYQFDLPQGKLVTCLRGRIIDVVVDIRKNSKTLGRHLSVELSGDSPQWLWVPPGFAHGFCVTSDSGADILYKVTEYYNAKGEAGVAWNDPVLGISWPFQDPKLSARDLHQTAWEDYLRSPRF